jgi:hypothetical protein
MMGGSILKRLVEKAADKLNVQRSAGFPWSKGIPDRNFPKPMTGGSGCMAPVVLITWLLGGLLILLVG